MVVLFLRNLESNVMPRRNSPKDIKELDDLNRLQDIVHDKRNVKRADEKKSRRDRHYEKQFIKNTIQFHSEKKINMTNSEIIEKLKLIVKPFVQDQNAFDNLTESTDFLTDLKINSANLVDIVLDIEDAFGIEIDNQSMEKMLNIQAALDIIETKLAQK